MQQQSTSAKRYVLDPPHICKNSKSINSIHQNTCLKPIRDAPSPTTTLFTSVDLHRIRQTSVKFTMGNSQSYSLLTIPWLPNTISGILTAGIMIEYQKTTTQWSNGTICQGCARDLLSRDWNVQNFVRDETERDETLQLLRCWPRPWSSRDSRESWELQRLAETFSVTYGKKVDNEKKIIRIN